MEKPIFNGIELLPPVERPQQLFILLHGVGGQPNDLLPLAQRFRAVFPNAVFLLPEGLAPFDGGLSGRQWFSISGVTEENRPSRVAEAMPALHALITQSQDRFKLVPPDTALVGFSQGAIMALEYTVAHDGGVGRAISFSGRFAKLPDHVSQLTTLHLLHGEEDTVIPVEHAQAAFERLSQAGGDVTLDFATSIGHVLHEVLVDTAIHRLQTVIPLRSWENAMKGM